MHPIQIAARIASFLFDLLFFSCLSLVILLF